MIYFLIAIGLTPGGSSTVHIYTQTIHRTTQSTQTIQRTTQLTNREECVSCPIFTSYTLTFALQLRKKHGKTSVRVRKTSVRLRKTSEYGIRITKTPTHYKTHTNTHITKQYKTTTVQIKTKRSARYTQMK